MLLTTAGRTRYYIILLYAISFANNNKPNWVRLLRTTTTTTTTKSLLQKKKKKKKKKHYAFVSNFLGSAMDPRQLTLSCCLIVFCRRKAVR